MSQARQRSQSAREERLRTERRTFNGVHGLRVRVGALDGNRDGDGGTGPLEQNVHSGSHSPTSRRDFDDLALGIAEIEQDLLGGKADTGNAAKDGEALIAVVGLGFEVIEDRVEGTGIGQGFVAPVVLVEEPVPKRDGADGEDKGALERRSLEADEGASVAGRKGVALAGDGDERI